MPRIYVGTYKKYTEGSIKGAWLDLEDYDSHDDFMQACRTLHKDEYDPEFMFQDHEGIPDQFITECSLEPEFWDYMNSGVVEDVKEAYMELFDAWDEETCNSGYIGQFDNPTRMAEYLLDETGFFYNIPESVRDKVELYFNFQAYARDMQYNGEYKEHNGHYFWSN